MTRFLRKALLVAAVIGAALVALPTAQTALTQTTLGAALGAPAQGSPNTVVTLASGTGVAVGYGIVVDGEYMVVQSTTPQTTRWNVTRGQSGTTAGAHASGAAAIIGASNNFQFKSAEPSGACVSTATQATPYVVVSTSVSIYLCPAVSTYAGSTAASWARIVLDGFPGAVGIRYTGWTYTTAGAITVQPGLQYIGSSGGLAMTLAAPSKYMDGMIMILQASTAQAHTVTYTAGFYGNTTSSDVATYGGAIGDNMVIYAQDGAWRVVSTRNVTIA